MSEERLTWLKERHRQYQDGPGFVAAPETVFWGLSGPRGAGTAKQTSQYPASDLAGMPSGTVTTQLAKHAWGGGTPRGPTKRPSERVQRTVATRVVGLTENPLA